MKILHLSDLHFKSVEISQDIVLNSLKNKLSTLFKENNKPNLILVTGDIAFSGKKEEYVRATAFFDWIISESGITRNEIFFIPGNHDVDRKSVDKAEIGWWYKFSNESQLIENLGNELCFGRLKSKLDEYDLFASNYMGERSATFGRFGEYVYSFEGAANLQFPKIKIVGLNSALFCGYDGDENRQLALSLEQVVSCSDKIGSDESLVIACVHHPQQCYHPCDKPAWTVFQRFSDIILSGHVHDVSTYSRSDGDGKTIYITAGATYESRQSINGFNIIEIDFLTKEGIAYSYKYLEGQHKWILNKDINDETDGKFHFTIPDREIKEHEITNVKQASDTATDIPLTNGNRKSSRYVAVLNLKYDELNREDVSAIFNHLQHLLGEKDTKMTVTHIQEGSVKIFFNTDKVLSDDILSRINEVFDKKLKSIKKIDSETSLPIQVDKSVYHWSTFIKPEILEVINSPGATFTHSRVDNVHLKDLYVSPNFRKISTEKEKKNVDVVVSADKVLRKKLGQPLKVCIYGPDTSGKTTILKRWYEKYYEDGFLPIFIPGNLIKEISIDKIRALVQQEFEKQYKGIGDKKLENYEEDRVIILIDDFHKVRFSKSKYKVNLINNFTSAFLNVIVTGNDLLQMEAYTLAGISKNIFEDYDRFVIIEFGPVLRYELVRKWNELGGEQLAPNELIRLNKEMEEYVESIVGKNFVPSYPVYILTILQSREMNSLNKPEYSLHGFYYELLINEALLKSVSNKADISLYYNYITEYAYFLFDSKVRLEGLNNESFEKFHLNYCVEYKVSISSRTVLDVLRASRLLLLNEGTITISYKYVYYFFVAKYLANNIENEGIKDIISALCKRIHRDEFGSIVMFLTHLSKNQFVIDELLNNSRDLFKTNTPTKMEDDVFFINDLIKNLPQHVYTPLDIDKLKKEELQDAEKLSEQEKEFDSLKDSFEYDLEEDINSLDFLSQIVKAMKTIEIVGQVTKKYWGELKAPIKKTLAEETYMLGLRTLSFYYSLLEKDTDFLVVYLKGMIKRKHLNRTLTKDEIDKASMDFLFGLCVTASFGVVKRITNAIGYDKLSGTFEELLISHPTTSVQLIDTSIRLDHKSFFPWDEIRKLKATLWTNMLAKSVLQRLVINYLYVFHTTEQEKQRICALLDIKLDQQRVIDATSQVKRDKL